MIADKGKYTLEFIIIGMLAFGIIRLFDLQDELRNLSTQIQKSQSVLMEIPMVQNEIRQRNDFLRSLVFREEPYCADIGEVFMKIYFLKNKNVAKLMYRPKGQKNYIKPILATYRPQSGQLVADLINLEGQPERNLLTDIKVNGVYVESFRVESKLFTAANCQ